jgi:hypothetical protein
MNVKNGAFTTCVRVPERLPTKFPSPPYVAVIECVPTERTVVERVATPPALRAPVPIVFAPSRKVTDPVGVPPGPDTVAVKVTDWGKVEGFGVADRVIALAALLTTCDAADVEALKLESPL